ncbi:amidase domain-containing protein [Mycobacteroides abscessus]|uniref:amidase domain-containing protein n=1 Tax=Mycobacteroides abscessus TaxID=36809 RepID=UPI000D3E6730|nr:amidase domain-containing protein [Mycobacteroides abscessus]PVA22673.1 hypothetical protein DDJ61_03225 [Mycobacteroides abscessus]
MPITLADTDKWQPEDLRAVSKALGTRGASAEDVKAGLLKLPLVQSWIGFGGDAAREALDRLSKHLASHAEEMQAASEAFTKAADEVETVKTKIRQIYTDAEHEGFNIDRATGTVTPKPNAAVVPLEMVGIQQRIASALAEANTADADLTRALALGGADVTAMGHAPLGDGSTNPSRQSAVDFADRYAKGWGAAGNPLGYNEQTYDCTNFVSYALRAGGFKPADPFHVNNNTEDQWFNTSLKAGSPSAAWDNANGLYNYINNGFGKGSGGPVGSVIGTTTFNPSAASWDPNYLSSIGMKPGDLIFYDWNNGEGISHAAMYVGPKGFVDMPGVGDAVDYHTNNVQHHSWALPHVDEQGNPTNVTYRFVHMQYPGD